MFILLSFCSCPLPPINAYLKISFIWPFQMYKIMKEHKNPKVLSEGLLWMVSAVDDFGTSHIKVKVVEAHYYKAYCFLFYFISLKNSICKDIKI